MQNLFSVKGKTVVVTGGSRGIGFMIARGFVENGAKVYISARKAKECEAAAAELSAHGTCIAIPADLGSMQGVEALAAALKKAESRLDVLVNNAGANWAAPVDEYPEAGWDKVQAVNLKAPFFLTQALLPLLRAAASHAEPARVINIGSIDGLHAPDLETYAYSSSKAGVIHLTKTLAKRLAREHINVNAIAPGPFESKMMAETLAVFGDHIRASNPRGRIGEPEDMAGTAMFLASRASSYITGVCIAVDGGSSTTL
jgi:NAD(P)-dependent dehydrogenase (short-subunit alcohol dehydrogenase family)